MKRLGRLAIVAALGLAAVPAAAQMAGADGDAFVSAVRDRDGGKATELLAKHRNAIVNTRDGKGDTGLIIAITRRDESWTGFLLNQGADPNYAARNGDTPLIAAARVGYEDAVDWLLQMGAKVDVANRAGETPLIVAVQARQPAMVRTLLQKGADPDKTDNAQGFSARDYARRDNRGGELLRLIEAKKPAAKVAAAAE
jgi:ankyrin repeat protein